MRGIEPRAFHMQSERSTTELHPRVVLENQLGFINLRLRILNVFLTKCERTRKPQT